ncbi:hypothetical protein CBM2637_A60074 [Cupriavidus taiwanensis]|nr:hypothetical protein CBM2637_A60074 [Cupriavidus taiwanensis]
MQLSLWHSVSVGLFALGQAKRNLT